MDINQYLLLFISFILAALMWSYALAGDTYLFATAEAIFIGGIAANTTWSALRAFYSGTLIPVSNLNFYIIIALIIGALAFTRLTRYRWAARYPTAILSGAGVGLIVGLNLRTQILAGVTDTITGMFSSTQYLLTGTAPSGFSTAIGTFTMPAWALWVLWWFSALMMSIMVLTFSYTTTVAGRFFDPKSRWVWVSRLGRYFIMMMLGYISCQTLLGDSLDALGTWTITIIKRTADQISTGIYA